MSDSKKSIKALETNIQEAGRYLDRRGDKDQPHTFQLIRNGDESAPILHGRLSELSGRLIEANRQGYNIYVVPNRTNLRGRKAADIIEIRSLFVDIDKTAEGVCGLSYVDDNRLL